MLLRLLRAHLLMGTTSVIIMTMRLQSVYCKPQDPSMFENVASQVIAVAGNMAEMAGNAGMMSKKMGVDLPFAKANSETLIGTGAALRNNDDDDDDDSDEDRRKRSVDLQTIEHSLAGEQSLLAFPLIHKHVHRSKRSPCHHGGAGTGAGGGGGDVDSDDVDVVERRRRRKAAARKRARTNKQSNSSRKRKLVNEDDTVIQTLTRRKRQSELDDLNQTTTDAGNTFSQHAQQIAEKLQNIWEGFMNSMNEMTQRFKQHFSGQNSTNTMEI